MMAEMMLFNADWTRWHSRNWLWPSRLSFRPYYVTSCYKKASAE